MQPITGEFCTRRDHSLSRRALLQGAVAGGMAFGGFGRLFGAESAAAAAKSDKRVILVFMSGGPSQFETWDPKPGQPTGGPHVSIPTSIPGVHFDEYLPNVARLGRGLVEPVDQMHDANPASHPQLLDRLADDFAAHGFDLRRLLTGILHSEAYLRSTRWTSSGERPDDSEYATAIMKPLSPDQLVTSVSWATGRFDSLRAKFEREKKNLKVEEVTPAVARRLFAPDRESQEFAGRFRAEGDVFEANAGQPLFLSYNRLLQDQLRPSAGNLVERLTKRTDDAEAVDEAFLVVLSRAPSDDERRRASEFLAGTNRPRTDSCRDLVWALLCCSEFRFNH